MGGRSSSSDKSGIGSSNQIKKRNDRRWIKK